MSPPAVLLLAEESRVALPILRSLGRRDIAVDLAWCPPGEPARSSRHVRRVVDVANPTDTPTWVDGLLALHRRERYTLVIPATDAATTMVHRCRDAWAGLLPVAIADAGALDIAINKTRTWQLADELGVPVPSSITIGRNEPVTIEHQGALVVKPDVSVDDNDLGKIAARVCATAADAEPLIAEMLERVNRVIVQEHVAGVGVGVEVVAEAGRVVVAFQHRRLHETTGFGSTYRVSEAVDPTLLGHVRKMLEALDYTGVAMFEFRVDDGAGRSVLLEINPRFWGSLPLTVKAGADFPSALYDLHCHDVSAVSTTYRVGLRSRDLLNDIRWMWRHLRPRAPRDPGDGWEINEVSRGQFVADVVRLCTFRDRTDTFDARDPMPAVRGFGRVMRLIASTVARRDRT